MHLLPILVIILLVTAGFLLVPFYLSFYLNLEGFSICGCFKVKWFGLILYKKDLPFPGDTEDRKGVENRKKPLGKIKAIDKNSADRGFKPNHAWFPKDLRILIEAIPPFFRVLEGLAGFIHVEHILCKVTFGLNDPADTAVICGYLWALTSAVSLPGTHIRVDPHFEGERLAGSLKAEIRSRLLWFFVASINALREKPIRRLLKELRRDEAMSRKRPQMEWPLRDPWGKGNGNAIEL
jgi:hypothetical protein